MAGRRGIEVRDTGRATSGPAGVSISGYHSGDITTVHVHGREPAPWPRQVGVLPREAAAFQRRDETDQLRTAVANSGTAVLCQVLRGTGGVGKTQLAAHYARQAWAGDELDVLVWVSANSRPAIVSAFAQAAEELLAYETGDPEQSAQAFLRWLEPKPPGSERVCRWLVVLDDIADPADVTGLWPAKNPYGRTVVTTRRRDAALPGHRIDLGVFTPDQAVAYLVDCLAEHGRHDDPDEIRALAQDLGHLPLALSQAAAYIVDAGIPVGCSRCTHQQCPSYRSRLAERATSLASMLPEPGMLPDDQNTTVSATWSLSVERADNLNPAGLARPTLQLAAVLDPNGIPQSVLTSEPARAYFAQYRTQAAAEQSDVDEVTELDVWGALRALHRLSLIDHDPKSPQQSVRIHQLIQRATRETLSPRDRREAVRAAGDALLDEDWPDPHLPLAQNLRANAQALMHCAGDTLFSGSKHHHLPMHLGVSLSKAGQFTAAVEHFQDLVDSARASLGPDHPESLDARDNLAKNRGEAGDARGAVKDLAELLTDRLRIQGPDHPDVLNTRTGLARWRGETGDAAGAAEAFAELLTHRLRVQGPDHPSTLNARTCLAQWRGRAGDATGAAEAFAELLSDHFRVQGPDHPDTLDTRHRFADWRGHTGDAAEAAEALVGLLADRVRTVGPDSPETLDDRSCLARWRGEAGDAAGAADAFAELLTDRLRIQGPDHPSTLDTRISLARWRGEAGDAAGAADAFAELLTDRLRIQGPDHPDTLKARLGLAVWRGDADAAGAAEALAELLTDRLRTQGPDHPDTLDTRYWLAKCQGDAGDAAGAAEALAELLTDRLRTQGPDHPDTLDTRYWLAKCQGDAGDAAGAAEALAELLTDLLRIQGPDHPDTLSTQNELAYWMAIRRGEAGDAAGAAEALAELLVVRLQKHGPHHYSTLRTQDQLAHWRSRGSIEADAHLSTD
ncbi:tetratricopeptide repeat protein [Streptomyces sp. HUAS MG47]|uniref:tetratricopeptide repeat protein n=1 Tax=Streptomyces solicamelliae TaxID=3231716 RepID=UPI0038783A27